MACLGDEMAAQLIGRHIVTDPGICHGKPTFRGTRILVADVLEQIASGMAWETVIQEWHGSVSKEAIAEALQEPSLSAAQEAALERLLSQSHHLEGRAHSRDELHER